MLRNFEDTVPLEAIVNLEDLRFKSNRQQTYYPNQEHYYQDSILPFEKYNANDAIDSLFHYIFQQKARRIMMIYYVKNNFDLEFDEWLEQQLSTHDVDLEMYIKQYYLDYNQVINLANEKYVIAEDLIREFAEQRYNGIDTKKHELFKELR